MKLGLIGAFSGLILGWWIGSQLVKGQWAEADNAALREQEALTADALGEFFDAEEKSAVAETARLQAELRIETIENELRDRINQAPIVNTVTIEVEGDCPAISCPMPDTRQHFRLWNAAITNAPETVLSPIEANISNAVVWRSHYFAGMDADCRSVEPGRNVAMESWQSFECNGKWRNSRLLVRTTR